MHPVIWEIIRSYVYASPKCRDGTIDTSEFLDYVAAYLLYAHLNHDDLATMARLFYYQIAVYDYYRQYYESKADNRDIYLHQAVFSTKLMAWFEKNVDSLSNALLLRFA